MSDNFRKEFTRSSHIKISQKALGKKPSWQNLPAVRSLNSPCQPPPKKKKHSHQPTTIQVKFSKKIPQILPTTIQVKFSKKKKNKFYQQPSRSTFQNNPPNFTNNHPGQMLVPKKKNPLPHLLQACFVSSS